MPRTRTITFQPALTDAGCRLHKVVEVDAGQKDLWKAWTTRAGIRSFFAPEARLEVGVGGRYEPLFDLEMPKGLQGGEGLQMLSYIPNQMLSFTWNSPPHFRSIRGHYLTWVVLRFVPSTKGRTRVILDQLGWGKSDEWNKAYAYFDRAWDMVLWRLIRRFRGGTIDWSEPWVPPKGWTSSVREKNTD